MRWGKREGRELFEEGAEAVRAAAVREFVVVRTATQQSALVTRNGSQTLLEGMQGSAFDKSAGPNLARLDVRGVPNRNECLWVKG